MVSYDAFPLSGYAEGNLNIRVFGDSVYHPTMITAIPDPKSIPANAPEHCPVCPVTL